MESDAIEKILESVAAGKTTPAEALLSLKKEPFTDLGYAKVDHHRALRQNATEVIYGEGKTPDQIRGIAESLQQGGAKTVLITRMKPEAVSLMTNHFADEFTYFDIPRVGLLGHMPEPTGNGTIVVAAAGTSDMYAAAVVKAATSEGIRIPDDLALIGFDNTYISQMSHPSVAAVSLPRFQLGYMACEVLSERIMNPASDEPRHFLLETELVLRDSV